MIEILLVLVVLLVLFALVLIRWWSTSTTSLSNEVVDDPKITKTVHKFLKKNKIRGSIIKITQNGKVVYFNSVGQSTTDVSADVAMAFRIGSITKSMVAYLTLLQIQHGLLHLDTKISRWFDNPCYKNITIENLLAMTSGIPSYSTDPDFIEDYSDDPYRAFTPSQLIDYIIDQPLLFRPGTKWNYSNTNYVMLGIILQQITQTPLPQLLRSQLYEPLKMNNTYLAEEIPLPCQFMHGFADARDVDEDVTFWNPSWAWAAGSVVSNIDDLSIWATELGRPTLLNQKFNKIFKQPDSAGLTNIATDNIFDDSFYYGLGITFSDGWFYHNGSIPGYNSIAAYSPSEKISVALTVNQQRADVNNYADLLAIKLKELFGAGRRVIPDFQV